MPTAGLGCRAASHVLSHSTPGGHLGVTAELMITGEAPRPPAVSAGARWGQSDEMARLPTAGSDQQTEK